MPGPFFSVIMPVYNAEKYIKTAIDTVLSQTFKDWELVIVNDNSTDDSYNIIKDFQGRDSRIRVINQSQNQGAAASRNIAIKDSNGLWCCFLDSDNEMFPGYMEEVFNKVNALQNDVGIFWTAFERVTHSQDGNTQKNISAWKPSYNADEKKINFLKNLRVGTGTALSVKKEYLIAAGLFDETMRAAEDTDLMYRLIWKCDYAYSEKVLYRYNIYDTKSNRLSSNYTHQFQSYEKIYNKNKDILKKNDGLNTRVLEKLIRYGIFSDNLSATGNYIKEYRQVRNPGKKILLLYSFSKLLGTKLAGTIYKRLSKNK